jgi:hypothetical protein
MTVLDETISDALTAKSVATVRRTLTFPIAEVVGVERKVFVKALRDCLDESTKAANLIVSGMFGQDQPAPPRYGGKIKLPKVKFDGKPIYARVTELMPAMPTGTISAIMQRIRGVYTKKRFDVMGTHSASVPSFRWPYPFYIRRQSFKLSRVKNESADYWLMEFSMGSRLADESRGRYTLRLKGGHEMRRQLRSLETAHAMGSVGEASVTMSRTDGTIKVNLSVAIPRADREGKSGQMLAITGGGSFLRFAGDCWLKPYHADHVVTRIKAHDIRRQRIADDLKYEKRWPKRVRASMLAKLDSICAAHNRFIDTFIDQASAMAIGFCVRQKLARLILDTRDRSFVEHFPWYMLAEKFRQKCEARSIEFELIEPKEQTAPAEPKRVAGPGDVAPEADPKG